MVNQYYKLSHADINYSESGMSGILSGGGGLEVELPSPESRRGSLTILDHIKRSAGNTPAKTKISQPHHNHHQQQQHHMTTMTEVSTIRGGDTDGTIDHHHITSNHEGFSIGLTESTSGSATDDDTTVGGLVSASIPIFQPSQLLSQKEDDGADFSTHDETYDDDKYHTRMCQDDERRLLHDGPLYSVSSLEEQFLYTNFEPPSPQRIAGHHISRTTRLLQGLYLPASGHPDLASLMMHQQRKAEDAPPNEEVEASPISSSSTPQSHGSNDDSTCWIEDGGNRISSLFDHNTIGLEKHKVAIVKEYESEEEDDDDFTEDGSHLTTDDHPLNAVESFLDDLADVEDVNQLRNLLFQMGSCHFSGQESVDDSKEDYYRSSRSRNNNSCQRARATGSSAGYQTTSAASASQYRQIHQMVSSSPKSSIAPQPTVLSSAAVMDDELTTVDSFSLNLILQNWSLQADTLMDIVTNSTTFSQTTDEDDESIPAPKSFESSADPNANENQRPKKLTAMTFLSSMFGCQQGGGYL